MKEATGELNMTVITLVAIAAIAAVFYFIVWPLVQQTLVSQTCRTTYGPNFVARKKTTNNVAQEADNGNGGQAKVYKWECGLKNGNSYTNCDSVDY